MENQAEVELRDGTSFGSVLANSRVEVNDFSLAFNENTQTYQGLIGKLEQWQRIPIFIQVQDGRKVSGYIAVVYLVSFVEPEPHTKVPASLQLPLEWEYSEGSMHTVDLIILKNGAELRNYEIVGNSTMVNFKRLGVNLNKGDVINIEVHPPWTSNYELHGDITKKSRAEFVTTAAISVRIDTFLIP